MSNGDIFIVPFFGQGHLFPCMELCKHLASRSYKTTLIISSNLSASIPTSLHQFPLLEIAQLEDQMGPGIESLLKSRLDNADPTRPICAVLDNMMSWCGDIFKKFDVPIVAFFTSGACTAAVEYAMWKTRVDDIGPGEVRMLPGLPKEMAWTEADLKQRPHNPPHGPGGPHGPPGMFGPPPPGGPRTSRDGSARPPDGQGDPDVSIGPHDMFGPPPSGGHETDPGGSVGPIHGPEGLTGHSDMFGPPSQGELMGGGGPPKLGGSPPWLNEAKSSIALMINTCDDLEGPFLNYLSSVIEKPVWGVGPLLPEQYWKSFGSILHDRDIRSNKTSNYTEDEVIVWLDSKPRGSVIYVSFGSEVGPTLEEYAQLSEALGYSNQSFIWVIQTGSGKPGPPPELMRTGKPEPDTAESGFFPHGLDTKVGKRGLIIHGWAPQLMILSHPSTGGFLSHCGWNSTVESIGRGVPFLAWPIRGDQFQDAKLVVNYLKIGYMISNDMSQTIKSEDIVMGMEKLMNDGEMKKRAEKIGMEFMHGFPGTSVTSLDAFGEFIMGYKNSLK